MAEPLRGVRLAWLVVGVGTLAAHAPLTPAIATAIGVPWAAAMALLSIPRTATAGDKAWRDVANTQVGRMGAAGIAGVLMVTALTVSPAAALLLFVWLAAAGTWTGARRGARALGERLAGVALMGLAAWASLFGAEAALRVDAVEQRLGTPLEIDRWWQRYDGLWERNVFGLRSPYETLDKPEGTFRVAALGDSFTWGDKVAMSDSTWPALLEERLQAHAASRSVEVVNLGEKGFTTVNEAERLRRLGWQFDPDLVVVQFYLNDILPSGPNFQRGYSGWIFPRAWVLPSRYRGGPAGRSALLYMVEGVLTTFRHGDRAQQARTWTEVYQRRGEAWQALEGALQSMAREARARDVPIVLVLFPDLIPGMEQMDEPPFQDIHDQVSAAAHDAGFIVVDLTPAFQDEGRDLRTWWAAPYDAHPDERAHLRAAERLAVALAPLLDP